MRNKTELLQQFLVNVKCNIRLIGLKDNPSIVINEKYSIPSYFEDNVLVICNNDKEGCEIARYDILGEKPISQECFLKHTCQVKLKKLYCIQYAETNLFLAGYNFNNEKNMFGKFPVFARYKYKLYYSKAKALAILDDFKDYPLQVI